MHGETVKFNYVLFKKRQRFLMEQKVKKKKKCTSFHIRTVQQLDTVTVFYLPTDAQGVALKEY
jgi:hypothetical protein